MKYSNTKNQKHEQNIESFSKSNTSKKFNIEMENFNENVLTEENLVVYLETIFTRRKKNYFLEKNMTMEHIIFYRNNRNKLPFRVDRCSLMHLVNCLIVIREHVTSKDICIIKVENTFSSS